ncbi:MAG TPA: ABC transporter substrate-binding protein [Pseudolabrys sp.]|jgi:NitT/TauT family transport system substrate-binding protein|nr:ABC transporter substrate-binding protein [Pseudolabrys sp.]
MITRALAIISVVVCVAWPAAAQEHVTVGTLRQPNNGALFLADGRGYFKAEGLDVELRAFSTPVAVVEAVAGGAIDFGLAEFSAEAFNLAGAGAIKLVAAQAREQRGIEGNDLVVSVGAYEGGMRKPENLSGRSIAITALGSIYHYQAAEIARAEQFDFATLNIKPMQTYKSIAQAVANGQVDAGILPAQYARQLMMAGLGRLMTWCSEFGEQQLGALFVTAKMVRLHRATAAKFIRAYRRGVHDYAEALARYDRYGKLIYDAKSHAAASVIARYIYPGLSLAGSIAAVELGASYIDPQARLDTADLERQLSWFKSQNLVKKSVDVQSIVDPSFTQSQ